MRDDDSNIDSNDDSNSNSSGNNTQSETDSERKHSKPSHTVNMSSIMRAKRSKDKHTVEKGMKKESFKEKKISVKIQYNTHTSDVSIYFFIYVFKLQYHFIEM